MIRPPSNQKTYDEFWSRDPAFIQPPSAPTFAVDGDELADKAAREAHLQALRDHQRLVRNARETGDWSALLAGAEQPTRFIMRPLPGTLFRVIVDLVMSERVGEAESNMLMVRAALVGVANLGDVDVKLALDPAYPKLGKIATVDVPNLLDSVDPKIVAELAETIRDRCMGVSPK